MKVWLGGGEEVWLTCGVDVWRREAHRADDNGDDGDGADDNGDGDGGNR